MNKNSLIVENLFFDNSLDIKENQEFLDACNDRVTDLFDNGNNKDKIIKIINKDIVLYKKENNIRDINHNKIWSNYYGYLIIPIILNIFYSLFYKNLLEYLNVYKIFFIINIGFIIFNSLLFGIKDKKRLTQNIKFGLFGLLFYLPIILYEVVGTSNIKPLLVIIFNLGVIPFGWVIIKSIFAKKITLIESLFLAIYCLLTISGFVMETFGIWLALIIVASIATFSVLIIVIKEIANFKREEQKKTTLLSLILVILGIGIYVFLKSFINPNYYIQIFVIIFITINLISYLLFSNQVLRSAINLFWIIFLLYEVIKFLVSVIRLGVWAEYICFYQNVFMFIFPMIITLVIIINNKKLENFSKYWKKISINIEISFY